MVMYGSWKIEMLCSILGLCLEPQDLNNESINFSKRSLQKPIDFDQYLLQPIDIATRNLEEADPVEVLEQINRQKHDFANRLFTKRGHGEGYTSDFHSIFKKRDDPFRDLSQYDQIMPYLMAKLRDGLQEYHVEDRKRRKRGASHSNLVEKRWNHAGSGVDNYLNDLIEQMEADINSPVYHKRNFEDATRLKRHESFNYKLHGANGLLFNKRKFENLIGKMDNLILRAMKERDKLEAAQLRPTSDDLESKKFENRLYKRNSKRKFEGIMNKIDYLINRAIEEKQAIEAGKESENAAENESMNKRSIANFMDDYTNDYGSYDGYLMDYDNDGYDHGVLKKREADEANWFKNLLHQMLKSAGVNEFSHDGNSRGEVSSLDHMI